ncbi:Ca-activated chloride channel family protein [Lachnospiraceae bacterium]|nr:Ca-activated chloride channel family protein [Lachnospiraceae bacterium]
MKKNYFKKSMGIILAAGLMMTSLSGCGSKEAVSTDHSSNDTYEATETSDDVSYDDVYEESCAEDTDSSYESYNSSSAAVAEAEDSSNYGAPAYKSEKSDELAGYYRDDYESYNMWDSREYSHVAENDFISTAKENVSTFSADVDTASYSNIRSYINDGNYIPEDAVRIEEMINYFHYDYKEPKKGEPFSVNMEVDRCPWNEDHQLVMIGLKAKAIENRDRKPTNFVFLIDTSGSMDEPNKLPLVKCAFVKLLSELDENDTVSIVTYAGSDEVVLEGESGENTDRIANALENLEAYGSTNGSAGINTAYNIAEKYFRRNGNNRVILATDGDLNVGVTSEDGLTKLITEKKESGIFLSVLGFGNNNLKDNKLEALADNGNGNYAYIDSVYEAKRVLVEEMGSTLETVAKDVKLQTTFDESVVEKYRLIGYENRMLAKEDFDDDTVDGGEIGSGHEVTALYEIVPTKDAADNYYSENHILDLSIRYKEPKEDESKLLKYACTYTDEGFDNDASDNMLWAESVACFGMILKNGEYSGRSTIKLAKELASRTNYTSDALRVEYFSLLEMADYMYEGISYNYYDDYDYVYKDYSNDTDVDINVIEAD